MTDARADALIAFGLTGDLGEDELLPAIAHLHGLGRLDLPVVGVGRSDHSVTDLRERIARHDVMVSGRIDLHYLRGDATEAATFDRVADTIPDARNPVVYAATPPELFGDLAGALVASRLPDTTRLVVEKPFGRDAATATELYERIDQRLGAERLRIVDHYLAKAAVENLLVVRTANPAFHRLLHRDAVARVVVEMAEDDQLDGRGSFYDDVGVIADVVQNHVLQLAAFALMDAPQRSGGTIDEVDAVRTARSAALSSFEIDPDTIVLGQYDGYRRHDGVDDESLTPTFSSFTMRSSLDRWANVPIHVVAGKALGHKRSQVVFELAEPGGSPFASDDQAPNRVVFSVSPTTEISLSLRMLDAGLGVHEQRSPWSSLVSGAATLCGPDTHDVLDAYATLLDDAVSGDRMHFATLDDVVAAWRVVEPLSRHAQSGDRLEIYPPGSDGPVASARS